MFVPAAPSICLSLPCGDPPQCNACAAGKVRAGESEENSCTICSEGKHSNAAQTACTPCAADTFSASPGNVECEDCAAGKQTNGVSGATYYNYCMCGNGQGDTEDGCQACVAGKYSDLGMAACAVCAGGKVAGPNTGAAVCQDCPLGKYLGGSDIPADHDNVDDCLACPGGSTTLATGAHSVGQVSLSDRNCHIVLRPTL